MVDGLSFFDDVVRRRGAAHVDDRTSTMVVVAAMLTTTITFALSPLALGGIGEEMAKVVCVVDGRCVPLSFVRKKLAKYNVFRTRRLSKKSYFSEPGLFTNK